MGDIVQQQWTDEQVAQHNTEDDCFVIVRGKVYNVSSYLKKHPGGFKLLFRSAGADATRDFEGMFHSKRARTILEGMCVGTLKTKADFGGLLSPLAIKAAGARQVAPSSSTQKASSGVLDTTTTSRSMMMPPPPARAPPQDES